MARWFPRAFVSAFVTAALFCAGNAAGAKGYYNLPGNSGQWWGHGFSGGYHAPFVLGPITPHPHQWPNVYRQPHAPNPYACAPCYAGDGHEMNGADVQEPTRLPPTELPAK